MKKRKSFWWLWLSLGAVISIAVVNNSVLDPIKKPLIDLLNSNFSTAFFGAAGGALAIVTLDWFRRQKLVPADINASIGVLASLSNTLLNMKKQHTIPMLQSYQNNVNEFQIAETVRKYSGTKEKPIIELTMYMKRFHCPELHFDLPMDRIFTLTDRVPQIVPIISQTKRSVGEVQNMCAVWNEMVERMKTMSQEEKIPAYFGFRASPDMQDTYFPDTVYNVSKCVDDSLFFIGKSTKALTKLGEKTLPFWLRKKIAKSEVTNKEYKALLPPENHLDGWEDD
jgi:hypothetical protein